MKTASEKTVLILVNKDVVILYYRLEVVRALIHAGYRVLVSTPEGDRVSEIEAVGATVLLAPMESNGTNPFRDLKLIRHYKKLIRDHHPDVVLTYTIKPNIYGGMAAAAYKVPYVANITGLGTALGNKGFMQKITLALYRRGFRRISKVFFQNCGDRAFFEKHKLAMGKHDLLPGSGVNLEKFALLDYPAGDTIDFAFVSRIRKDKGIDQFIDAAKAVKSRYPHTEFHVCGSCDEEYRDLIERLHQEGVIRYHGLLKDTRLLLKDVHCVIHPTYYPEGMSNVLLEGAATGRAIISTDRTGCREAIDHGVNGYIVQEQNSEELIEAVETFMELSYEEKRAMGLAGRRKMEREFDRAIVVKRYLDTVAELTADPR